MTSPASEPILIVQDLRINLAGPANTTTALLRNVSFSAGKGQLTAIVGESGSGKTLTALSLIGLLPSSQMSVSPTSKAIFSQQNLLTLSADQLGMVRGREIAMVFQDPNSSLNPVLSVGRHLMQPLTRHMGLTRKQAHHQAVDLLDQVGISHPELRMKAFPHELSGGQKQRVMIAMAISCNPKLLIADEPTSALDVTVQRQILDLIARLQAERGLSVIMITHDLGAAFQVADRIVVMRNGEVQEEGNTNKVLREPETVYTRGLIRSYFQLKTSGAGERQAHAQSSWGENQSGTVLEVSNLKKDYFLRQGFGRKQVLNAVRGVSLKLRKGETLGVVGESGSGKTTLAMMIMRLTTASSGSVTLHDQEILQISNRAFRPLRKHIQIVFQNPYASLNPRWTVGQTLTQPMKLHGLGGGTERSREVKATRLLDQVGLPSHALGKYPDEFSGGERQRIAIARCLSVEPRILICDECVSALDMSIQLQILDLLRELQKDMGMSYLFVSHDLAAVRYMAHRVMVMQDGEVVESGQATTVFTAPAHAYTRQLLASVSENPTWQQ